MTSAPPQMSTLACLRADLAGNDEVRSLATLLTVRSLSTCLFRLSQAAGGRQPLLGYLVKTINHILTGADLAWQASVGPGLKLYHPTGVVIGPDVVIGSNCEVQQGVTFGAARKRGAMVGGRVDSPVLGDDISVGSGAKVIGPIRVGNGSVIGANAVVIHDVPANAVAVGIPAASRIRG